MNLDQLISLQGCGELAYRVSRAREHGWSDRRSVAVPEQYDGLW